MRIDEIMTREVWTCRQEDSLEHAAHLMWDRDCGCLPVVSGDGATQVAGLITDRDICMCALFQGKRLADLRVSEAMSKQARVCRASDSIAAAEKAMREARIRRLPVLGDDDSLVGMISLSDLAREAERELEQTEPQITETEVGGTLAAICQPAANTLAA